MPLPRSSTSGRPRARPSPASSSSVASCDEPPEGEVAAVDLQQQRGVGVDRRLVVAQVGAVGGADLDQAHTRRRHDLGHAERAADLDQLAARHDRRSALREPREHEQHRGGVVVDDQRARRARQEAQLVLDRRAARAALTAREVELEIDVAPGRLLDGAHRAGGERGAAEVGVQRDAGRVDHGLGMEAREVGRAGARRARTAPPRTALRRLRALPHRAWRARPRAPRAQPELRAQSGTSLASRSSARISRSTAGSERRGSALT